MDNVGRVPYTNVYVVYHHVLYVADLSWYYGNIQETTARVLFPVMVTYQPSFATLIGKGDNPTYICQYGAFMSCKCISSSAYTLTHHNRDKDLRFVVKIKLRVGVIISNQNTFFVSIEVYTPYLPDIYIAF